MNDIIIKDYLNSNTKRRSGQNNLGVKFIVAHDTGNPNSTAKGNVSYYKNSENDMSASAHVFIDDKDIIECIPLNEKAWHVRYNVLEDNEIFGYDANDYAIGVELCYFPSDVTRTVTAYKKYVKYIVDLLKKYNLNETRVIGHNKLDPTRKVDPMNAFNVMRISYDHFIKDIKTELTRIDTITLGAVTLKDNCVNETDVKQIKTKVENKEIIGLFNLIKRIFKL